MSSLYILSSNFKTNNFKTTLSTKPLETIDTQVYLKTLPKEGDMEEPYELIDTDFLKANPNILIIKNSIFKEEKIDKNIFMLNKLYDNVFTTSYSECKTKKFS